jgi:Tfp pilus assembly protein FimT
MATDPTMAELNAAVDAAWMAVNEMPTFASTWASAEFTSALNALIAAAEARGAARERGRECVWRYGNSYMATTECGVKAAIADRRCHECGGRVRVEEAPDA